MNLFLFCFFRSKNRDLRWDFSRFDNILKLTVFKFWYLFILLVILNCFLSLLLFNHVWRFRHYIFSFNQFSCHLILKAVNKFFSFVCLGLIMHGKLFSFFFPCLFFFLPFLNSFFSFSLFFLSFLLLLHFYNFLYSWCFTLLFSFFLFLFS